jgi:hypothetical protein
MIGSLRKGRCGKRPDLRLGQRAGVFQTLRRDMTDLASSFLILSHWLYSDWLRITLIRNQLYHVTVFGTALRLGRFGIVSAALTHPKDGLSIPQRWGRFFCLLHDARP